MRTVLTCTLVAALLQQVPLAPPPRDSRAPDAVREGTGTIKGRVYDRETGAPVPNASVTLAVDFDSLAGRRAHADRRAACRPAGAAAPGEDRRAGPLRVRAAAGRQLHPLLEPARIQGHLSAAVVRRARARPIPCARRPAARCRSRTARRSKTWTCRCGGRWRSPGTSPTSSVNRWPACRSSRRSPAPNQRSDTRGPYQISRTIAARSGCSGWRRDATWCAPTRRASCPAAEATSATERYMKTCAPIGSLRGRRAGRRAHLGRLRRRRDPNGARPRLQDHRRGDGLAGQAGQPGQHRANRGQRLTSSGSQSDGNGRFTFTGLVPGDYTIVAQVGNKE